MECVSSLNRLGSCIDVNPPLVAGCSNDKILLDYILVEHLGPRSSLEPSSSWSLGPVKTFQLPLQQCYQPTVLQLRVQEQLDMSLEAHCLAMPCRGWIFNEVRCNMEELAFLVTPPLNDQCALVGWHACQRMQLHISHSPEKLNRFARRFFCSSYLD